ncbi:MULTISPECIES: ABC transporter ATP-binding protein [Halobacterium]|uniref:ABC transporter ATP-binding protein n=1 Tax=Halobacterium TaxID=2239 RepID=UPI0019661317|nr:MULTISPECIES: ABC transporter ATP-binding protein [Halobacterium]MDL0121349.1 ABC transporter ATP-binding protein [Halobacterium salinarum]MDL0127464.1 ABC transporter ATP-binding protein [Halobacterium salinarum]MDL0132536.1 ABC transporter ATP-binding protein [Halobacterium salinarum]QRY25304.1 ABC transporter ATP-binding protein [Halobacterium sp. BOL4-2]
MDSVLVADDVAKSYGDVAALRGVSLSVSEGEVFALVGPNGAGKTTLVRCLTGTTTPDGGRVELLGEPPQDAQKQRLGLLPQSFSPPDRLTAAELVGYYAGLYADSRAPDAVLESVGLDPDDATRYGDLSGGQRRRACVAAALVNDPDVLFLDEPTTGVDPAGRHALWSVFEGLAADGTTIVLTTHDMAEASALADRVGLLADGDIAATGTPADLVAAHAGSPRLVVDTDADPELAGFDCTCTEAGLVFEGVDPTAVGEIAAALDDADVAFDALSWREPSLEDAYLALAGDAERGEVVQ